jgi:hypothetical protein
LPNRSPSWADGVDWISLPSAGETIASPGPGSFGMPGGRLSMGDVPVCATSTRTISRSPV